MPPRRRAASGAATGRIRRRRDAHKGAERRAPYRDLSYDTLVNDFIAALPSPRLADQIMRDNPARLYGF